MSANSFLIVVVYYTSQNFGKFGANCTTFSKKYNLKKIFDLLVERNKGIEVE